MTLSAAEAIERYREKAYEPCAVGLEVDLDGGLILQIAAEVDSTNRIVRAVIDGTSEELIMGHQMTMCSYRAMWRWKEQFPSETMHIEKRKLAIVDAIYKAVQAKRNEQKEEPEDSSDQIQTLELAGVAAA